MTKHASSTDSRILARLRRRGRGWVFTPTDFADLGSRDAIASALKRHKADGTIRALARGLYDFPNQDAALGTVAPSTGAIVRAVARRDHARILPYGAHAANQLGLSEQVPMRTIVVTDAPSRVVKVGGTTIRFKHAGPSTMATAGRRSGIYFQALRYLGKDAMDDRMLRTLAWRLTDADRKILRQDLHLAPAWIARLLRPLLAPAA